MKRLFFPSSPSQVPEVLRLIRRHDQEGIENRVITNDPSTHLECIRLNLPCRDSGFYYRKSLRSIRWWHQKVIELSTLWHHRLQIPLLAHGVDATIPFELWLYSYIGEIAHSVMVAQRILEQEKPTEVFTSSSWSESPLRTYQKTSFSLEHLVVSALAKQQGLSTTSLHSQYNKPNLLRLTALSLTTALISIVRKRNRIPVSIGNKMLVVAHHYQLLNVLSFLQYVKKRCGRHAFIVVGKFNGDIETQLQKVNIEYFNINNIHTYCVRSDSMLGLIKAMKSWISNRHELENYFNSIHPILWEFVRPKLFYYFVSEIPKIFQYVSFAKRFCREKPLGCFTLSSTDVVSRSMMLTVKSMKIPIVELAHGGIHVIDDEYPFRTNDAFCVVSNEALQRTGGGRKRNVATGLPWFDDAQYPVSKKRERSKIRNLWGIGQHSTHVLVLPSIPFDLETSSISIRYSGYQFIKTIFDAVSLQTGTWHVTVRPHPSSTIPWVIPLSKPYRFDMTMDQREYALDSVIASADIIIMTFTTALFNCMLQQKPILLTSLHQGFESEIKSFLAVKLGAVAYIDDLESLPGLLTKTLNPEFKKNMLKAQKIFLKKYAHIENTVTSRDILIGLLQQRGMLPTCTKADDRMRE